MTFLVIGILFAQDLTGLEFWSKALGDFRQSEHFG